MTWIPVITHWHGWVFWVKMLHSNFESPGYDILTQQFWKPLVMTSLHCSSESPWLRHPYPAVLKAPGYDILTQQFWKPLVMTSLHSSFESPWLWHPYTAVLKAPAYDILTQQFWKPLVMTSLHSSFESPGYDILTQQFWKPLFMTFSHGRLNFVFSFQWLTSRAQWQSCGIQRK